MTTTNKTVLGIVAAAVVLLIVVYALGSHNGAQPLTDQSNSADASLQTNPNDSSDAALTTDASTIDSQMSASDQDASAVQQGLDTHAQAQ
ncbi:MAG: hypothetical protein JWL75_629 [Parcubacteria group bacterium]|nr:hypothetical protein [Parcubacteria group bacterium]